MNAWRILSSIEPTLGITVNRPHPERLHSNQRNTVLHCYSTVLHNLVGNSGETQCLEEAEQQARQVSMFLILLFKFLIQQFPFVSFLSISVLSRLHFSIFSLLPLHHPFFLFCSILCPPKIKTSSLITFCFTNGTYFCILFHTMTYFFNNVSYKLVKTNF